MIKALPVAIVIFSLALPIWFAGSGNPRRALRRLQWSVAVAALVWTLLCVYLYPRFVPIQ